MKDLTRWLLQPLLFQVTKAPMIRKHLGSSHRLLYQAMRVPMSRKKLQPENQRQPPKLRWNRRQLSRSCEGTKKILRKTKVIRWKQSNRSRSNQLTILGEAMHTQEAVLPTTSMETLLMIVMVTLVGSMTAEWTYMIGH